MMCTRRVNFLELLRETETDLISRFGSHFGDSQRAKSDISLFTINETALMEIHRDALSDKANN